MHVPPVQERAEGGVGEVVDGEAEDAGAEAEGGGGERGVGEGGGEGDEGLLEVVLLV